MTEQIFGSDRESKFFRSYNRFIKQRWKNHSSAIVTTEPLYVTEIKQYCSVVITKPLYGTGIIQHISVDLIEPFNDSGTNYYSSAVITEQLYCSGIKHKKKSLFSRYTESL